MHPGLSGSATDDDVCYANIIEMEFEYTLTIQIAILIKKIQLINLSFWIIVLFVLLKFRDERLYILSVWHEIIADIYGILVRSCN